MGLEKFSLGDAHPHAKAMARKEDRMSATLGPAQVKWEQPSYNYAAKCLERLRQAYTALRPPDREVVDGALAGTGCAALFAPQDPNSKL